MKTLVAALTGVLALGSVALVGTSASAMPVAVFTPAATLGLDSPVETVQFCHFGACRGYGYHRAYHRRVFLVRPHRRGICHYGRCRGRY